MLTEWFARGRRPVCLVEAIGGMGKSALSWAWLHWDVLDQPPAGYTERGPEELRVPEKQRPQGVLWWSFYEAEAHFGAFLKRAMRYLRVDGVESDRERLEALLYALQRHRILLIFDGFERELRAYSGYRAPYQGDEEEAGGNDCCDPRAGDFLVYVASKHLQGRVLITSRLLPNELKGLAGLRHERLQSFQPDDVVSFFQAAGVRGTRAEIGQAVAPYGGHPLSVSLLARAIVKDRRMRGDINAAGRHTVLGKLKGKGGHHILEVAYDQLAADRRELLGRIAAFRSPMDYNAIQAVAREPADDKLDAALDEMEERGLLFREEKTDRYDLHPIVRRYAYDRLSDKAGVHGRLEEYFQALPAPEEDKVRSVEDLAPTIELYWHMVGAGRLDAARELFRDRLNYLLYYRFGAYEKVIELLGTLFPDGEDRPPRLKKESAQAWTLNELANSYSLAGRPSRAVPLAEMQNDLQEKADHKRNLAAGLANLACKEIALGRLESAEGALRRSIELCREIEDEFQEAIGRQNLGRLLAYEGHFAEAERELRASTDQWKKKRDQQGVCLDEADRAQIALLRGDASAALEAAREARQLANRRCLERDIIQAEWLLGLAHAALGDRAAAEPHLTEALRRCRGINLIELEPSILLALARATNDPAKAEEALRIAERCEYRLNQADIHNFLARCALDSGDKAAARSHAETAKERAWCDGPPHYYKPAYEEAEALLVELDA